MSHCRTTRTLFHNGRVYRGFLYLWDKVLDKADESKSRLQWIGETAGGRTPVNETKFKLIYADMESLENVWGIVIHYEQ